MLSAQTSMPRLPLFAAACGLLLASAASLEAQQTADPGRLWGRVSIAGGSEVEGFLRWDRNETGAADLLDGVRGVTEEGLRARREVAEADPEDRRRSVEVMGYRVTWEEDEDWDADIESGLRFGWVERLVPDGDEAELHLRTGATIRLRASSTDIGPRMRGLEVESADGDVSRVRWGRIEEVVFLQAPPGAAPASTRIHGTVTTDAGVAFTGWIAWDADEVFEDEELDGDEGEFAFGDIARIERVAGGALVTLRSGEQHTLTGTNDVSSDNRGIHVSDPGLGRAQVDWGEFRTLDLHPPAVDASVYPGGEAQIYGVVTTESGRQYSGPVLWDLDEAFRWQFLNGWTGGADVDIEFSRIARIEKARGGDGVLVTLLDGRSFPLEGSNDVNASNRGILIETEGERQFIDWSGFSSLDLEAR